MNLDVREMLLNETGLVIDYFHSSTPEHLETMGVDPSRLPARAAQAGRFKELYALPSLSDQTSTSSGVLMVRRSAFRVVTRSCLAATPTCICM
jgi:hypothetical protein